MKAIATVEAGPEGAFLLHDGKQVPVILFERHKFREFTDGRFDNAVPDLSNPVRGGYGTYSSQHVRLARAAKLDRTAAMKSCSWGLYQIMGFNHEAAGFPELQRFINAMYRSADDHLRALVMFLRHDEKKVDAIRSKNWNSFAYLYNGPGFARDKYDERIAAAYEKLTANA